MVIASPLFVFKAWNEHALLTVAEMRRAEELTYAKGVTGFQLMQRAGTAAAKIIRERWPPCRAIVLCGPGNNGGDGFVVAEALLSKGWDIRVAALRAPKDLSSDAARAAGNWRGTTETLASVSFARVDLVVDALFGTGLGRPIEGVARAVLEKLMAAKIPTVAIDLPSGVNADTGQILGRAPQAALTITFFRKKPGHLLLPGALLCGETIVADIGIADDTLDKIKPATAANDAGLWFDLFPFPKSAGNKYTRGNALIYGGPTMTGAARLSARAAQRIGAGLVTLASLSSAVPVYAGALESVIVRPADTLAIWQELLADVKRNAILIGPGLGLGDAQAELVLAALATGKMCVLDADALSNFADKPERLLSKLHPQCALTPHEGEFARLFGARIKTGDKLARTREAAKIAGCIVLLKGADTVVASPDGFAVVNGNAPPYLAVAGAGDVLAGMILGLVAQGMPVFAATAAAAWLHGSAAQAFGPGLIAEDLVERLPAVLRGLPGMAKGV